MSIRNVNDWIRWALAWIKASGNNRNTQGFLLYLYTHYPTLPWSEEIFDAVRGGFAAQQARQYNTYQPTPDPYVNIDQQPYNQNRRDIHINTHWDFWDCLLLQCWFNSLFGGHNHAVNNISNFNYGNSGNNTTGYKDKKKESDDGRKLLAAGIAVVVAVAIFHISMCYRYHISKKMARESGEIYYLDNKLKILRNIEFLGAAVSLVGLIACVVYPVLPTWGLVALGVHSLVCFMGGLSFHMQHERESEYIKLAKNAAEGYLNTAPSSEFNPNAFTDNDSRPAPSAPGAEFPQTPPPPYSAHGQTAFYFSPFNNVDVQGGPQIVKS